MKLLIIGTCLFITTISFAAEVNTECSAMVETRENILKEAKPESETGIKSKVTIQ